MQEIKKINKNNILIVAVVIIAIGVTYLAINKLTEDTPQEKLLNAMYGTTNQEEIKKINKDMLDKINRDADKAIKEQN